MKISANGLQLKTRISPGTIFVEEFTSKVQFSDPGFHNFYQHFSCSILNWYKLADAVFLDHLSQVLRKFEFRAFTLFSQDIKRTNSSAVWRYLIGYKNLLRAIENLGIAVVYGIRYLSACSVE